MRIPLLALALVAAVVFAACGDDDDSADVAGEDQSTVSVTLREFSIEVDRDSVPQGLVTFTAQNAGPDDAHELVIASTDLPPDQLPTKADGSVDEEQIQIIEEIEEFPIGETQLLMTKLKAGKYVLLCNVVEENEGQTESHYQEGMRAQLTVE